MGGIHYVSVLILASLLVFGCLGAPQETPPAGPTTPSGGAAPGGTTPSAPSAPAAPTDNLEGLSYSALLALGQSLECDVTMPYATTAQTAKLYIKGGSDDIRMEITGQSPTCPTAYYVIKEGGTMYMTCATGQLFEGMDCDWLVITPDPSEPDSGYEAPDLTDVPPSNIQCKVWVYDDTKFQTPGTTCTMEDLFQGMYQIPE